jgi:hypothetical protein
MAIFNRFFKKPNSTAPSLVPNNRNAVLSGEVKKWINTVRGTRNSNPYGISRQTLLNATANQRKNLTGAIQNYVMKYNKLNYLKNNGGSQPSVEQAQKGVTRAEALLGQAGVEINKQTAITQSNQAQMNAQQALTAVANGKNTAALAAANKARRNAEAAAAAAAAAVQTAAAIPTPNSNNTAKKAVESAQTAITASQVASVATGAPPPPPPPPAAFRPMRPFTMSDIAAEAKKAAAARQARMRVAPVNTGKRTSNNKAVYASNATTTNYYGKKANSNTNYYRLKNNGGQLVINTSSPAFEFKNGAFAQKN